MSNHIYYDLLQTNLENTDTEPKLCEFNDNRNQNFLENPEDYKMSIVRFMIETPTLPVFRPTIQNIDPSLVPAGINPIDYTIYSITLKRNTAQPDSNGNYSPEQLSQQFIIWETQTITKAPPLTSPYLNSNKLQDNSTGYYDCFNYGWFINLINKAFARAASDLLTTLIPAIYFDSASQLFVLAAPIDAYNTNNEEYIEIYMNKNLYQLFSSLPEKNVSFKKDFGLNKQIMTNNYQDFNTTNINGDINLMVYSEYPTVYLWSPVTSIVFTSSTLPVLPSNASNPIVTRDGENVIKIGNPNTRMTITDLVAGDSYKPYLVYTPSAEYRYFDLMKTSEPLKDIDIQVYWQDKQGFLNEFKLSSGSSATIKILFSRKVPL
jgi:hypothetical protein